MNRTLRSGLLAAADALGASSLLGAKGPRILLYHGVTSQQGAGIFNYRQKFIATEAFRTQLAWLKQEYEIISLAEFIAKHHDGALGERALAVTFDDGYANNYTDAFPALRDLSIPATFFITTGFIDGAPLPVDRVEYAISMTRLPSLLLPWTSNERSFSLINRKERIAADLAIRTHLKTLDDPSTFLATLEERAEVHLARGLAQSPYAPMRWEHMREMEAALMTFAPHTRSHPILSRLPRETAYREIADSQDALKAHLVGPLLTLFAYPNGAAADYTPETIVILKELGFTAALTTSQKTVVPGGDPYRLPRFTMDGASSSARARLAATGAYARLAGLT